MPVTLLGPVTEDDTRHTCSVYFLWTKAAWQLDSGLGNLVAPGAGAQCFL